MVQHWVDVSCLLGSQTTHFKPMAVYCWASVVSSGPAVAQHRLNVCVEPLGCKSVYIRCGLLLVTSISGSLEKSFRKLIRRKYIFLSFGACSVLRAHDTQVRSLQSARKKRRPCKTSTSKIYYYRMLKWYYLYPKFTCVQDTICHM